MRIPEAPPSRGSFNFNYLGSEEIYCLKQIRSYFSDPVFDDRYFTQFGWFSGYLPPIESILNLGCSRGRETFALGWELGAERVLGIDLDESKIKEAQEATQCIQIFRQRFSNHYSGQARNWYETMPQRIKEGVLPEFSQMDATENLPSHSNGFDLTYCRYTLWKIADRSLNDLSSTCERMAEVVKPKSGRIVIVEPSKKDGHEYGFVKCFQDAGLTVCAQETDPNNLGWLEPFKHETDPKDPKGHIFEKSGKGIA